MCIRDSIINFNNLCFRAENETTLISAKNRVDLSSISEVRSYITEWPRFFGPPCTEDHFCISELWYTMLTVANVSNRTKNLCCVWTYTTDYKGGRSLWHHIWGVGSSEQCDETWRRGRGGYFFPEIVWCHLWMTPKFRALSKTNKKILNRCLNLPALHGTTCTWK